MSQGAATTIEPIGTPRVAPPARHPSRGWRRRLAYIVLVGYALLMMVPFAWTVVTSFKTLPDSTRPTLIPDPFTLQGWQYAIQVLDPSIVRLLLNSLVIAGAVTISNVLLGSLAGYAFARLRFRGREVLFIVVLATLMIPDQLRLVPVYILFSGIGLTRDLGQYVAVFLLLAISATSIFLLRQYFLTLPKDLEEAARIDGAGHLTTFWRVMMPLASPAIAAVAVLQFQGAWNGFFWPVVFLTEREHATLPLGLYLFRFAGGFATNWPPLMATVVIATIPIVVLYVFFQRYFVEGIAASGVKG
ncbi:MAG: carbohydrate ABC transporter permease [Chloroflexi bacterium]|nr:carbohydrate ABC transporter permease [Chloroflexota bacterium]